MPHERVTTTPSGGPHNSLWHFSKDVSVLRVIWNSYWIIGARWVPSFRVKRWMLRRTGANIGKFASFGFETTIDILFPQDITIGEEVVIGYNTTILCHGYLRHEYQRGPVTIERDASIGAGCTILPGVTIGEGAVIGAMSLVNKDVPAGEFWGGIPAKQIRAQFRKI
jgi:acetyltransferase-like isoleucine patch superfamily enzyme